MPQDNMTFMVEGARLIFRNFSGRETSFNPDGGERTFCVILPHDLAAKMEKDGWNVKTLKPQEAEEGEEAEPGEPYIQVKVKFKVRPPMILMITNEGRTRTHLTEEMVGTLDWADILNVDLIARAYEWGVGGKTGITAYLQSMYVTIQEDALARKYAMLDENG